MRNPLDPASGRIAHISLPLAGRVDARGEAGRGRVGVALNCPDPGRPSDDPSPHTRPAGASIAASRSAFTFDGAAHRASPATRSPRRCSPTASISSGGRSSITGRAASSRRERRSRTRWSPSIAAADARRRTFAPPRSSSTRAWSRAARTAGRRSAFDVGATADCLVAVPVGRLLLQDLHVAARRSGRTSTSRLIRAERRPRQGAEAAPTPTATFSATPIATCSSSAPDRRASPPRAPRPRRARASSSATSRRSSAARCSTRPWRRLEGSRPAELGEATSSPISLRDGDVTLAAADHGLRLFRRELRRPRRARHRPSRRRPIRTCRASGCGRCGRRRWCSPPARSSARSSFRKTTGPASCSPRRRAPISTATARRPGTRAVVATAGD